MVLCCYSFYRNISASVNPPVIVYRDSSMSPLVNRYPMI